MFRTLLGHLQALCENRSKSYLHFSALWDPNYLQILLYECEISKFVYIYIYIKFIYNKNSTLSGRHVWTFVRLTLGSLGKQIQELSIFKRIWDPTLH
jgi:hypothetical protein